MKKNRETQEGAYLSFDSYCIHLISYAVQHEYFNYKEAIWSKQY